MHKVWAAHDCGRALNPVSVEGQVIGSVWMGIGQALQEEFIWKDGLLMNPGMLEYKSPSAVESPEVVSYIVESIDPEGPFGAKEASEGSLAAVIPAVANAIYDAVGVRLHECPFTPERVLAALQAKRAGKIVGMTNGVDPTNPLKMREHGGSTWFKGSGPQRHAQDPARAEQVEVAGGLNEPRRIQVSAAARPSSRRSRYLAQYANGSQPRANESRAQIVAGGTDLLPSMKQRLFTPEAVVDIRGIAATPRRPREPRRRP